MIKLFELNEQTPGVESFETNCIRREEMKEEIYGMTKRESEIVELILEGSNPQ